MSRAGAHESENTSMVFKAKQDTDTRTCSGHRGDCGAGGDDGGGGGGEFRV